jgi:hypothetical protein
MGSLTNDLIRRVEREVLDIHHLDYPLLRLSQDGAVTRLLKMTGDITRQNLLQKVLGTSSEDSLHRGMGLLTRGLSHCLRWVLKGCSVIGDLKGDHSQEDQWALDLLRWGINYALLATDHVAWSKSTQAASADERERVITFHPFLEMDVGFYSRQASADVNWWRSRALENFPMDAFVKIFNEWQRKSEWTSAGLEFESTLVRRHHEFAAMHEWTERQLFPELAPDCSLGEYTIGDLRQFFACLFTTCECVRTLEDEVDRRVGEDNRMGTWTFQGPRLRMIAWLAEATGLGHLTTDAITQDMTLNPNRFHCSISTTPFVQTTSGWLFLLPRLFACLDAERTFASALTVGTGRKAYDGISTSLERHYLGQVDDFLSRRGLRVYRQRRFVGPKGEVMTPDFVITDGTSNQLIIADFKNALAASAVAEVINRIKVYREAISQVERYLDMLRHYPMLLDDILPKGTTDRAIRGLIIFRVPTPLPVQTHEQISVDDWFSMRARSNGSIQLGLRDLFPPERDDTMQWRHAMHEIPVGQWTYRRTVLVGISNST